MPRIEMLQSPGQALSRRKSSTKSELNYQSIISRQDSQMEDFSDSRSRRESAQKSVESRSEKRAEKTRNWFFFKFNRKHTNNPQSRALSEGRKASLQSNFSEEAKRFEISINGNVFEENPGCCLEVGESVARGSLGVASNRFRTNLFDFLCYVRHNGLRISVKQNVFEVAPGNPEKTIKIAKRCRNLRFRDNQFIRIQEDAKRNIWLRLLGCVEHKESGFYSRELPKNMQLEEGSEESGMSDRLSDMGDSQRDGNPVDLNVARKNQVLHNIVESKAKNKGRDFERGRHPQQIF